ncbi:MAG: threonylcarbamoyl-AMP synthase [Eubacterium sp.]|nr:threonylcarbamoyl-AMP synthase [Eubacterium sp.]
METLYLGTSEEDIARAGEIVANGGLVAFPTETVYGLGADAFDPEAVENIYTVKGRPADNPSIVHISAREQMKLLTPEVTPMMERVMDAFWPGPVTMICLKTDEVPYVTTGGLESVGIRMPSSEAARALIDAAGCPIAAPSANLSGKPSPTSADHVKDDFDGKIGAIIDGGPCEIGIESTVIDMTGDVPMILRPGIMTQEDFEEKLGVPVILDPALNKKPDDPDFHPKAPGMKYRHYAPKAPMIIFEGEEEAVLEAIEREKTEHEMAGEDVVVITFGEDEAVDAARELFARLREADKENADLILAAALPQKGVGFSVMNRMLKSAGFNIRKV